MVAWLLRKRLTKDARTVGTNCEPHGFPQEMAPKRTRARSPRCTQPRDCVHGSRVSDLRYDKRYATPGCELHQAI